MLSIQDVADRVESEGLDYAIMNYLSPSEIQDDELSDLVAQARYVLSEIQLIIEDYLP